MERSSIANTLWPLTGLFVSASIGMVQPILAIYFYQDLGFSLEVVGFAIAATYVATIITKIPTGFVGANRAHLLTVIGYAITAMMPVLYIFFRGLHMILLLRVIHGLGFTLTLVPPLTLCGFLINESQVKKVITRFTTGTATGFMLGPLLATFIIGVSGIKGALAFASLLGIPAVFIAIAVRVNTPITKSSVGGFSSLAQTISIRAVAFASIISAGIFFAFGVTISYAPLFGTTVIGLAEVDITKMFVVYAASMIAVRLFMSFVAKSISAVSILIAALIFASASLVIIAQSTTLEIFAIAFIFGGLSHGIVFPVATSMIAGATTIRQRMFANSIYSLSSDTGSLIGPIMIALTLSSIGLASSFLVVGLMPLSCMVIALVAWRILAKEGGMN